MKIAIISDTHDNIPNIQKALGWINKEGIEILLHCGDISTKETMESISSSFKGKITAVFGNMDINPSKGWKFPNVQIFEETAEIEIGGKKIAIVHKPDKAKELALSQKYDIVFYGHTHKPWKEKIGECLLANPGNIANLFFKPSFAVYDTETGNLELKILETL